MSQWTLSGSVIAVGIAFAACGAERPASPASPVAPTCTYQVHAGETTFGPQGGKRTVAVVAPSRCGWSATSSADWVTVQGTGEGNGEASISVSAFSGEQDRSASVSVAQQTISISQQGCVIEDVQPSALKFGDSGGARDLTVIGRSGCAWSASDVPEWIQLSPQAGTAPTTVTLTARPNPVSASREVNLTIANRSVGVHQDSAPQCGFRLQPASLNVAGSGGAAALRIDGPGECAWTASDVPGWLTVTPPQGEGSIALMITAQQNPGDSTRSATLRIGGELLTVQQEPDPAARMTVTAKCGAVRAGEYAPLACVLLVTPATRPASPGVRAFADLSMFGGQSQTHVAMCVACGGPPITFDMDLRVPANVTPGVKTFAIWTTDAEGRRAEATATLEIR